MNVEMPAAAPQPASTCRHTMLSMMPGVLAAIAFLSSIGAAVPQVSFTTLGHGANSQISEARTVVVRTSAEWAALWKDHGGEGKPAAVDFAKSMVIGVFSGTRSTTGHAVQITRIEKAGAAIVVHYEEQAPAADAIVGMMLTAPFHLVRTDLHAGPIKFQRAR